MTGPTTEPQPRRPHDPENLIGRTIAGRYQVRRCISQGGMGVIYLARQEALDREVILKVVRSDLAFDETEARFRREARSLSLLSHPNVVQIFDHGYDEESQLWFIVMEYVRGLTLSSFRRMRGGRLSPEEFLPIARQLLEGVAEAHRIALLHRDLKPSNVMLTSPDGLRLGVKILDFGLSKLAHNDQEQVTRTSHFAGSILYLAPELIKNKEVDTRADVYSLGVIFYQLLTGRNPLEGSDPYQLLLEQVTVGPRPMQDLLPADHNVPLALIELVNECTAISVVHRPPDASAVLDRLLRIMQHIEGDVSVAARAAAEAQSAHNTDLGSLVSPSRATGSFRMPARPNPFRVGVWLAVGLGVVSVMLLSATLVVLIAMLVTDLVQGNETAQPTIEAPAPAAPSEVAAAEALRQQALTAIREGDYERAVALTTEALALHPAGRAGSGDLEKLLEIVTDLRDRQVGAPPRTAKAEPGKGQPAALPGKPKTEPAPRPEPAPQTQRGSPGPEPAVGERPPAPEPTVGIAVITSTPPGLTFEIPGVARGETPFRALDVPAGTHAVTFYRDGSAVRTVEMKVPRGGLELLDVVIEAPAITAPRPVQAPQPQPALQAPVDGPSQIYVFVPSGTKPRVVEDALRAPLGGMSVKAFGSFRELKTAMEATPPHAVIAPREVLGALGLSPTLQGRDSAGQDTERYLLLGTREMTTEELERAVIGTIDLAGRESSAEFVARALQTSSAPQIKRVTEEIDLLSMLQVGAADAVLLPESSARRLMSHTQMKLVETRLASGAGLPALSVLDEARRGKVEAAVRGLGPEINAKVGVARWGD